MTGEDQVERALAAYDGLSVAFNHLDPLQGGRPLPRELHQGGRNITRGNPSVGTGFGHGEGR